MTVHFQSFRSSSSGNCLRLWTKASGLLIDCGLKAQYLCENVLMEHVRDAEKMDGVIVSHAHGDHICAASMRVLSRHDAVIFAERRVLAQVKERHFVPDDEEPTFRPFPKGRMRVGDFSVQLIELPHEPGIHTYGFVIRVGKRKLVICTDFNDYRMLVPHLVDADFIFIEANHDLELLRQYPNYASRYHLSNPKTAQALLEAVRKSKKSPRSVMLGHLSGQRNDDKLAMNAVRSLFRKENVEMEFELCTAPRLSPSTVVQLS
jgi:phosphoribosyl 1,2-cyclic phosphodiesterase